MKAFVLYDDSGKIRGIAVPAGQGQKRISGILSKQGHQSMQVDIPDGSVEDVHSQCLRLYQKHRVDVGRRVVVEKKPPSR